MKAARREHLCRVLHIEVLPPKQNSPTLAEDLERFREKARRVISGGHSMCITDNAMGLLAFQGTEVLDALEMAVPPDQVMIHLNVFHTREELHRILGACERRGIRQLLVVSGDGSERLPRLRPEELGIRGPEAVTSVELLGYIRHHYPGVFDLGVAYNPYEPPEHEWEKMERKLAAGAQFVVTQPLLGPHPAVDRLLRECPGLPVVVEAWMSRKLYHMLSDVVGYRIGEDEDFDPMATLAELREAYPDCGVYLSMLGFKTQLPVLEEAQAARTAPDPAARGRRMVVCIKQVPASHDAKIDPETKRIVREGLQSVLNPFDLYAIEEALRWREAEGGEVIVLSMGPPSAERVLREALSMGADRAILLTDRKFGGSDTWATSYVLSQAIRKIGEVDLVLCGKQAIDGDTAQVGPGIAAHLDWPQATMVMELTREEDGSLTVSRMHEDGHDECRITGPAVLTLVKGINVPRVPTLTGTLAARKVRVETWGPEDIGAREELIGLDGSPTRVVRSDPPPARTAETLRIRGEAGEAACELVRVLRQRNIL